MIKGKIRKLARELPPELKSAEEFIIKDAEENEEKHIDDYDKLESSYGSRYICTDLMKETYPLYSESVSSRQKYGGVIHNSSACLAAEVFARKVKDPNINKCIFLTGVPGAGKSYLIHSIIFAGVLGNDVMVYEGDITTPTIEEKMAMARDNGKEILVLVVNPTLELANENALRRYIEVGRGAPTHIIARIMSKLPTTLKDLQTKFDFSLGIFNKKTNYDIYNTVGFEEIDSLNQGTYDEILEKSDRLREELLPILQKEYEEKQNELEESLGEISNGRKIK